MQMEGGTFDKLDQNKYQLSILNKGRNKERVVDMKIHQDIQSNLKSG